ncbi:Intraflagellar transport protein 72/74, partial [Globisporangium splendens]
MGNEEMSLSGGGNESHRDPMSLDVLTITAVVKPNQKPSSVHKLNPQQVTALLQTFWAELLQNNVKMIKKILTENHQKMDFAAARYRLYADGTALHICAQNGFIAAAQLMLEFGIDINAQNKVGLTPLHVACKSHQAAMATFLLEEGALLDIPDHDRAELIAANQAAQLGFGDASMAYAHSLMSLEDVGSCAREESEKLAATREIDTHWAGIVHRAKEELSVLQRDYKRCQQELEDEEEALAVTKRNLFQKALEEREHANRSLAQTQNLIERTEREIERQQRVLDHEFGLLETAREFPNDPDIQIWILGSIRELAGEIPEETQVFESDFDVAQFLFRPETASVILDAVTRFPSTHHIQVLGMACLVDLVGSPLEQSTPRSRRHFAVSFDQLSLRLQQFVTLPLKSNALTIAGEILVRYPRDMDVWQIGFEVIYYLLSIPGTNKHMLQFCQNKQNQQLPLQFLRLLQELHTTTTTGASPESQFLTRRCHIAYFLLTLAKYNVKKPLLSAGVVPTILQHLGQLTACVHLDEVPENLVCDIAPTISCLLATLAILHSIESPTEQRKGKGKQISLDSNWEIFQARDFVESLQIFLNAELLTTDRVRSPSSSDDVVYWMLKLLRNLVWHPGIETGRIRRELDTQDIFTLIANGIIALKTKSKYRLSQDSSNRPFRTGTTSVGVELIQSVWISKYDGGGRILPISQYVLDSFLSILRAEVESLAELRQDVMLVELETVLSALAVIVMNALRDKQDDIDRDMHKILAWILQLHEEHMLQHEPTLALMFVHILRIYLAIFQAFGKPPTAASSKEFHNRSKQVGLCATLREFKLQPNCSDHAKATTKSTSRPIEEAERRVYQ